MYRRFSGKFTVLRPMRPPGFLQVASPSLRRRSGASRNIDVVAPNHRDERPVVSRVVSAEAAMLLRLLVLRTGRGFLATFSRDDENLLPPIGWLVV